MDISLISVGQGSQKNENVCAKVPKYYIIILNDFVHDFVFLLYFRHLLVVLIVQMIKKRLHHCCQFLIHLPLCHP